jgi:hypothetical protein
MAHQFTELDVGSTGSSGLVGLRERRHEIDADEKKVTAFSDITVDHTRGSGSVRAGSLRGI